MGDCLNDANHSNGIVLGGYIYDTHHYKVLNSVPFRCLDLCKRTPPPPSVCLVLNSGLFQPELAFQAGFWHSRWDSCCGMKSKLGLDCSSHCHDLLFASTSKRNWWPERNRKPKYKNWWNLGQNATWITRAAKQASVKRRLERERGEEKKTIKT